ncbi:hypothetical protein BH23CHL8_BH23CHL8_21190 [soil metagenome]
MARTVSVSVILVVPRSLGITRTYEPLRVSLPLKPDMLATFS